MKSTAILFVAMLSFSVLGGQSVPLVDGGYPNGWAQYTTGGFSVDECARCVQYDKLGSWETLDTGQVLTVWGSPFPPCDTITVRIANGTHVVYDTCMELPLTGAGCQYAIDVRPDSGSRLLVYWRSSYVDSMGVMAVSVNDGQTFASVLFELDTCGTHTGVDEPFTAAGKYYYVDPETFIRTLPRDFKPEHIYLRRE